MARERLFIVRVEPSGMGSVLLQKDRGVPAPFSLRGPPGPGPDPNHTWPSASSTVYYLSASTAVVFRYSSPAGPGPPPQSTSVKNVLRVCCVYSVFCECAMQVFSVCVPCACVFCASVVCVLCMCVCVCVLCRIRPLTHILQG